MIFKWDTIYLSDATTRAYAITVNGRQLVQEAQFLRAASVSFFGRANKRLQLAFSVKRSNFATIKLAEQWMIGHHGELANRATLTITTGLDSESPADITCQNAVLESVDFPGRLGIVVEARYTFLIPSVTGIGTTPSADDNLITGSFAIPNGVDTVTVDDLTLLGAPTRVFCTVRKPAAGYTIIAVPVDGSYATTGFTAHLSAETDSANYYLDYALVL